VIFASFLNDFISDQSEMILFFESESQGFSKLIFDRIVHEIARRILRIFMSKDEMF